MESSGTAPRLRASLHVVTGSLPEPMGKRYSVVSFMFLLYAVVFVFQTTYLFYA